MTNSEECGIKNVHLFICQNEALATHKRIYKQHLLTVEQVTVVHVM